MNNDDLANLFREYFNQDIPYSRVILNHKGGLTMKPLSILQWVIFRFGGTAIQYPLKGTNTEFIDERPTGQRKLA